MNPDRADELAKTIKRGSEISAPERARCSRCLRMHETGELHEGLCIECTAASKDESCQSTLRKQAFERDKGVCFACKTDTQAERAELDQMLEWAKSSDPRHAQFAKNRIAYYRDQRGYLDSEINGEKALFEVHHVKERARGGANTLSNCSTACAPCHAKLTGDFSRIRKVARKPRSRFGR